MVRPRYHVSEVMFYGWPPDVGWALPVGDSVSLGLALGYKSTVKVCRGPCRVERNEGAVWWKQH